MYFDEARRIAKENKEKFLNADDRLHYVVMVAVLFALLTASGRSCPPMTLAFGLGDGRKADRVAIFLSSHPHEAGGR